MKILVSWSGGKDSQACLIYAVEKYGAANVTAVFCDTGWEHDVTYRHVKMIPEALGIKLIVLESKEFDGFVDMAATKTRFPSSQRRFCTSELKIKPMIDYILSQDDNLLIFQGIRNDESTARSEMTEQCRYFKYYFDPFQNNRMVIEKLKKKNSLTDKEKEKLSKAKSRLKKGKEDPKYHTYRKQDVFKWCSKYADDIIRPIIEWTGQQTISYCLDYGLPLNPLYYKGAVRVGCYPCIMCSKAEIKEIVLNDPDTLSKISNAEKQVGSSFFPPDYVPKKYRRQRDKNGKPFALIDDVASYIRDKNATGDLFAEIEKEERESSGRRCMSAYSICE